MPRLRPGLRRVPRHAALRRPGGRGPRAEGRTARAGARTPTGCGLPHPAYPILRPYDHERYGRPAPAPATAGRLPRTPGFGPHGFPHVCAPDCLPNTPGPPGPGAGPAPYKPGP
ncbi:hypothetical protein SHO565_61090 [Streptomyces sp. HO565]